MTTRSPTAACVITETDIQVVRSRVGRAIGRGGLTPHDRDDLAQHALSELCRRTHLYDSSRSPREAFVANVALNAASNIVERRSAAKRDWRRCRLSLDDDVRTTNGNRIPRAATIAADEHATRTRGARLSFPERTDLRLDLREFLGDLPEGPLRVCRLLMRVTPTEAARQLGVPRGTLHDVIKRIRARFKEAGLDAYVDAAARRGR